MIFNQINFHNSKFKIMKNSIKCFIGFILLFEIMSVAFVYNRIPILAEKVAGFTYGETIESTLFFNNICNGLALFFACCLYLFGYNLYSKFQTEKKAKAKPKKKNRKTATSSKQEAKFIQHPSYQGLYIKIQ